MDNKAEQHCIHFLIGRLALHSAKHAFNPSPPPFFLGLNGVQGSGKTYLVTALRSLLSSPPYNLETVAFSLDDIYLTHADQQALATAHPTNPLLQHRGQPSTHDIPLGLAVLNSIRLGQPTKIPAYDKSAHGGQGDRLPEDQWETVNDVANGQRRVKLVIFEGWCVGFRSRPEEEVREAWEEAVRKKESGDGQYNGRLGHVTLEDVMTVNEALKGYDAFTDQLDAFIHLDAEDTHYVYDWRQEQERSLLASKGTGMTPDQVNHFVDGYYPSYELFTTTLREGVFKPRHHPEYDQSWKMKQLRLVIDRDRKVTEVIVI